MWTEEDRQRAWQAKMDEQDRRIYGGCGNAGNGSFTGQALAKYREWQEYLNPQRTPDYDPFSNKNYW